MGRLFSSPSNSRSRIFSAISVWKVSLRIRASSHLSTISTPFSAFALSFKFIRSGRDDDGAIMLCHRQITFVDDGFVAIWFLHCAFQIVRDEQFRHAAEEGQAAAVGVQPGHHILPLTCLDVGIVGCSHHSHEDSEPSDLACFRTDDRHSWTTEVDKELFAGAMLLAHREAWVAFHAR